MSAIDASLAGQFRIGKNTIIRLGYGAMRLAGAGIWGPPSAPSRCRSRPAVRDCSLSETSVPDRPNESRRLSEKVRLPFAPSTST
jgi:hypothetical protein